MLRLPHELLNGEEVVVIPEPALPAEGPTAAQLADALWSVTRSLRRRSMAGLAEWDLSPSHARALRAITAGDPLRLSALAERLRIAPRSATEVVDALAERGLAQRLADPDDRRATLLAVTPKGRALQESIEAARAEQAERLFSRLSALDRTELARILQKLQDDLT